MKIIVTWTNFRYEARLEDKPEVSGMGKTKDEAIGNLVLLNQELFGVMIEQK